MPYSAWGSYLLDADIAVSIHLDNLETRFSFRTRILDYLWARRPMILTGGDASVISSRPAAWDHRRARRRDAIVEALLQLLGDPPPAADFGPTLEEFQWPAVGAPLVRWMERARRAPDMPALELR